MGATQVNNKCGSMTWRATSVRPYVAAAIDAKRPWRCKVHLAHRRAVALLQQLGRRGVPHRVQGYHVLQTRVRAHHKLIRTRNQGLTLIQVSD